MIATHQSKTQTKLQQLTLSSPAFVEGEDLPRIYTADGSDLSPPLHWDGIPNGTSSFILFFEDLDVAQNSWVHWLLFDIPAEANGLPAGLPSSPCLANGTRHGLCWGVGEYSQLGYQGPALSSPQFRQKPDHQDSRHRLCFSLIALDIRLALPVGSSPHRVRTVMDGHQLSTASLTCLYGYRTQNPSMV